MKSKSIVVVAFAIASACFAPSALATESDHTSSSRQSKFAACAHESKGLKGEEHQHFMSQCLKGNGASDGAHRKEASHKASADGSQQSKMKTCNEAAGNKNLHGDERRSFMSTCLKG